MRTEAASPLRHAIWCSVSTVECRLSRRRESRRQNQKTLDIESWDAEGRCVGEGWGMGE